DGFCLGGGNELAMACNMRWASENAKFGQPEVNLGLICGYGGSQRLARLIGKGRAIELLVSGNMIVASKAYEFGLVNHVVAQSELLPACKKFLQVVMTKGPLAVQLSIDAVSRGCEMSLDQGVALENELFGLISSTEDSREGTSAFLEKRKAEFIGK
ncbi:MAG: enoyl-CoA hydratase, partial [Calditrichaeota bacterium]